MLSGYAVSKLNLLWEALKIPLSERGSHKIVQIYEHKFGNPLINLAESFIGIIAHYRSGKKTAVLTTGFPILPARYPETDGPLGTVFLASFLVRLGFRVIILVGEITYPVVKHLVDHFKIQVSHVEICPSSDDLCSELAKLLVREYSIVDLAVAIESPSPNRKQVYHNMHGKDISQSCAHFGVFYKTLMGINPCGLTIGIGDGGNEIGMGLIESELKNVIKYGDVCQCPCRGGIISAVSTDYLIPAQTSNIGAYILTAVFNIALGINEPLDIVFIESMLEESLSAGAFDAFSLKKIKSVDGIPFEKTKVLINKINEFIKTKN